MRMKAHIVGGLCAALCFAALSARAEADQHRYVGVHPIAKSAGGGVCYIELPHVHVYAPARVKVEYRDHEGWHHFVGDPVAHGYDGPKHAYHSAHPIYVDVVVEEDDWDRDEHHVEWCYLKGPHYHPYEPGVTADFEVSGDVYWYVGDYSPQFKRGRKPYGRINVVYEPIAYTRPVVEVEPPSGYVDVLVVAGPGVVVEGHPRHRARGRAGVHIEVPAPSVEVNFGARIGVGGRHHHPGKRKGHRKHRKHKKHKKYKKHKKHRKFRWR